MDGERWKPELPRLPEWYADGRNAVMSGVDKLGVEPKLAVAIMRMYLTMTLVYVMSHELYVGVERGVDADDALEAVMAEARERCYPVDGLLADVVWRIAGMMKARAVVEREMEARVMAEAGATREEMEEAVAKLPPQEVLVDVVRETGVLLDGMELFVAGDD